MPEEKSMEEILKDLTIEVHRNGEAILRNSEAILHNGEEIGRNSEAIFHNSDEIFRVSQETSRNGVLLEQMDDKIVKLAEGQEVLHTRIDRVETKLDQIDGRLLRVEIF